MRSILSFTIFQNLLIIRLYLLLTSVCAKPPLIFVIPVKITKNKPTLQVQIFGFGKITGKYLVACIALK